MTGAPKKQLSLEKLKHGRLAALQNAEELVRDAEVLHENERWARSYFLSQIAVEELGKYVMIVSAIANVVAETMDWKAFWKRFRNHEAKVGNVLHLEYFMSSVPASEYLKKLPTEKRDNNYVKMVALYSDFDGSDFYSPAEVISQELASTILKLAKQRLDFHKAFERDVLSDDYLDGLTRERIHTHRRQLGIEKLYEDTDGN